MFVNRLKAKLQLKIKGKKFEIPAGNIKIFNIALDTRGFDADVLFWFNCSKLQSEDKLFSSFVKEDRIDVIFTLDRAFDKVGESTEPLVLSGVVTTKEVYERVFSGLSGQPVLQRRYSLNFSDVAQVLWRQHRSSRLYVDKSFKELIEDNRPADIKLKHTWKGLTTKYPILALPLGEAENSASFYDFLLWLLDRENADISYDSKANSYEIFDRKKDAGREDTLPIDDIGEVVSSFAATRRATRKILNVSAEAKTKEVEIANKQKVSKIEHDYRLRSPIAKMGSARKTLEASRAKEPLPLLRVDFSRYPSVTFRPNFPFNFKEDWSRNLLFSAKKYRVRSYSIQAKSESQEATDDDEAVTNAFEVTAHGVLEEKLDLVFAPCSHIAPTFPMLVEGKVLSEIGKDEETTYQYYTDKDSSLDFYKVKVPLFKGQKVIVAYEPLLNSGHFYFPAHRDQRVLIELDFLEARIVRFLDWKAGARLPKDTQGNHILLGKKEKNETSLRHVFDGTKPVFRLMRTNEKDEQIVEVSEGKILLSTEEKKK